MPREKKCFRHEIMRARSLRGMSQRDLADKVGCSRQAIQKIETGENLPSLELAVKLCSVLRLNIRLAEIKLKAEE